MTSVYPNATIAEGMGIFRKLIKRPKLFYKKMICFLVVDNWFPHSVSTSDPIYDEAYDY